MNTPGPIAVVGATGFIGESVCTALRRRGAEIRRVTAPRFPPIVIDDLEAPLAHPAVAAELTRLTQAFQGCAGVVNAAGVAAALSDGEGALLAANALVPTVAALAATAAGVPRFIQVSSGAVQGRRRVLDSSTEISTGSAYSRSKAAAEPLVCKFGPACTTVYRPAGVHGHGREVTIALARLAQSPLSSVAAPGTSNAPQALVENVADAIAFLTLTDQVTPAIVHHPSEGLTVTDLLKALGGRTPRRIPSPLARAIIAMAGLAAHLHSRVAGIARRLEVLWTGQEQAPSWLTEAGWRPVAAVDAWERLRNISPHGDPA